MKISRFRLTALIAVLLIIAASVYSFIPHPEDETGPSLSPAELPPATGATRGDPAAGIQPDEKKPQIESGDPVPVARDQLSQNPDKDIFANACALVLGQATLVNASRLLEQAYYSGWSRPAPIECNDDIFEGKFEKGDTIAKVLENAAEGKVQHYVNAASKIFPIKSFRAGQPYAVVTDPATGRVKRFEYEINDSKRLVVDGLEHPTARLEKIEYDTVLAACEGVIEDSLFQSVADIGESPQLALRLVDMFGSEINFIRDIQEGDSFSALIEKRYRDGEYRGYGRIIAATFTCKGKKYEAFLFNDGSGRPAYFNAKGENLHKTLLQAPLAVTRITSRFTNSRKHPILGFSRPHHGVDYGAPTGTPVKAVGDGTVSKRGWAGGYGNQIVISHSSGLESMYAHLSGFARGLRQGQKVRQGQVIGFVGSTGLSTGPHLDFRLRQNGKFINPVKAINPRGAPVAAKYMPAFKRNVDKCRFYLAGDQVFMDYTVDSIVPLAVFTGETEAVKEKNAPASTRQSKKGRQQKRSARSKKRS